MKALFSVKLWAVHYKAYPPKSIPCSFCNNFIAYCTAGISLLYLDCFEALQYNMSIFANQNGIAIYKKIIILSCSSRIMVFHQISYFSGHILLFFLKKTFTQLEKMMEFKKIKAYLCTRRHNHPNLYHVLSATIL